VGDYMMITCYHAPSSSTDTPAVESRMRVAAFLQPQDPLYFDAGGKAVAVYDYALTMQKV